MIFYEKEYTYVSILLKQMKEVFALYLWAYIGFIFMNLNKTIQ